MHQIGVFWFYDLNNTPFPVIFPVLSLRYIVLLKKSGHE